jgi:hypothetical protein
VTRLLAALLAGGAMACAGHGLVLSQDWPAGVPGPVEMAGWERIDGDVETTRGRAIYALYVDPRRGAIYTVTRYRVRWKELGADGRPRERTETEKYVWLRRRELGGAVCFERGTDGQWRELASGSAAFRAEMATSIAVYGLHRAAHASGQR